MIPEVQRDAISVSWFPPVCGSSALWSNNMLNIMWQLDENCTFSSWTGHTEWSCQKKATHLESLADSWIQHGPVHPAIHPDSADKEILLFDLLWYKVQQMGVTDIYNNVYWSDKGKVTNNILTSLKTCKSATQITTLTRWSSLERLRESAEWTSDEESLKKKEDRKRNKKIM